MYDFSQKLTDIWLGSNFPARREILDCVSLNRELTPQGLVVTKRSPFDLLAERASCNFGRGDRRPTFPNELTAQQLLWGAIAQTIEFTADEFYAVAN